MPSEFRLNKIFFITFYFVSWVVRDSLAFKSIDLNGPITAQSLAYVFGNKVEIRHTGDVVVGLAPKRSISQ